jgi:molecular chaperone GrpE (heat shock protein)
MNASIKELENIIKDNLLTISRLTNHIEQAEIEKDDWIKEVVLGIIDLVDSFERLEEEVVEKGRNQSADVSKIVKRYHTIHTKLLYFLQKYKITKIEFPDNRLITGVCEVVGTEPDSAAANDEIVSIVQNGYLKENELIRAAQIIVVKN